MQSPDELSKAAASLVLSALLSLNDSWFRMLVLLVQVFILILLLLCLLFTHNFLTQLLKARRACLPYIQPFCKKSQSLFTTKL